jgi:hypothetical protein
MGRLIDSHVIDVNEQGFSVVLEYEGEYKYSRLQAQATRIYRQNRDVRDMFTKLGKPDVELVSATPIADSLFGRYMRYDYEWEAPND